MAETKTKDTTQGAPQAAPPAQLPATTSKREAWETFQDELNKRADEIGSQLPSNVSRERFIGASLAAVKATPAILTATARSLMAALTKAAQDGLLPDGREGIITVYNTKEGVLAQWNPMFYGIRKRARELDGIIIDAQVVYIGDDFDYELGDSPFIKHKPKARTEKVDASAGMAVYAIFRHPDQGILHREVMWKVDVFDVMNQSRAKGSLMWTTFWTEGWRKTVGRRGSKSVPVSPQLERLIQRDDENFTFATDHPKLSPPTPPSPPAEDEPDLSPTDQQGGGGNGETSNRTPAVEPMSDSPKDIVGDSYFDRINEELETLSTEDEVIAHYETLGIEASLEGNDAALDRAAAIRAKHIDRVTGQGSLLEERAFPGDLPLTKAQKVARTP